MNYAQWYEEHKSYWNDERQRRKLNAALTGRKSPDRKSVIEKFRQEGIEMDKKERAAFYETMPLPNPKGRKKKKKKQNGWKDKPDRNCHYTGRPYAERHELFYGDPLRQISIEHGFQIDVCWPIHKLFHGQVDKEGLKSIGWRMNDPLKWANEQLDILRGGCQRRYEREEQEAGATPEEARRRWIALIGRSYLD